MKRTKLSRGQHPKRRRLKVNQLTWEQKAKWLRAHNIYRQRVNVKNPSLVVGGKIVSDWKDRLHAAGVTSTD